VHDTQNPTHETYLREARLHEQSATVLKRTAAHHTSGHPAGHDVIDPLSGVLTRWPRTAAL
jgi:hypothetical protein